MTETETLRAILCTVTALPGGMFWRNNTGVGRTAAGTILRAGLPGSPDIIGAYRGRAVGIEVKSETGRVSRRQSHFQAAWERAGGLYIVARSVDDALAGLGVAA